jgi:hypothetical protein
VLTLLFAVIFCRVFLNRQTAEAHQRVFLEIHSILQEDMGTGFHWHHLYADNEDEFGGFALSLMADQHRGQALGKH